MNWRIVIAVVATLLVLTLFAVVCHGLRRWQADRRTLLTSTPMPPPGSTPEEDALLLARLFSSWHKYVWGGKYESPTAVGYAWKDPAQRWRVFVMTAKRPGLASAYVTLPNEPEPLHPMAVSWSYISHVDTCAFALIGVSRASYSREPMALPPQCRAPDGAPRVTYIPPGSA